MLTSPLASTTGWTWTPGTVTDLPATLAGAFPSTAPAPFGATEKKPLVEPTALIGTSTAPTALVFLFTGSFSHKESGSTHWIWGVPADLAAFPELRTHLPDGNPLIALRFTATGAAAPDEFPSDGDTRNDPVTLAGASVNVQDLAIVAALPRRPGLDTLAVLRALRTALNAAAAEPGSTLDPLATSWAGFITAADAVPAPLRLLEPGGRPVTGREVTIERPGEADTTATLAAGHGGDVLAATGLGRADLTAGSRLIVAAPGEDITQANASGALAHGTTLDLTGGGPAHLDVARLEDWFGPQGRSDFARFSRGNTVTPLINGPAFFDVLFTALERTDDTADKAAAFYLAGYAINDTAKLASAGSGVTNRSLADLIPAFAHDDGEARFLALQFLQLEPGFVDTIETSALVAALLLSIAGGIATFAQDSASWDQPNFFAHSQALAFGLLFGAGSINDLLNTFEENKGAIDALAALPDVEASLDPYPAECPDNPLCSGAAEIVQLAHVAQKRFNAFHQKIAVVRNIDGLHAYCGGIDLNPNRLDDRDHGSRSPYHDVHARIDGPAVEELAQTFIQRWNRPAAPTDPARLPLALDTETDAFNDLDDTGPDIVQVARTYYGPDPADTARRLPFATAGERTILDTLIQSISQARRYIYIEDQYLTPPFEYTAALLEAAEQVSGPLIIVIPSTPDQPFGFAPRQSFIQSMTSAWGDRFKIGVMRHQFYRTQTNRTKAIGRLWLTEDVAEGDNTVKLGPPGRLPGMPFWLTVGNEAMYVKNAVPESQTATQIELRVDRAGASNLFDDAKGTKRTAHKASAAVNAGAFAGIYVHSKMMLIDDVFACIGSANLNRRGHYSDGECNIFALREELSHGDNWIRDMRIRLWAEMCGVEEDFAFAAFADPARNLDLFDRKFTARCRFTPFAASPFKTDLDIQAAFTESTSTFGGVGFIAQVGLGLLAVAAGTESDRLFDTFIDPSSEVAT